MHGENKTSVVPRTVWTLIHVGLVSVAGWILFGGGFGVVGGWFGQAWQAGNAVRRAVLLGFGVVLWARMTFTALYLLTRKFGWDELVPVVFASAVYQVGFALLGAGSRAPINAVDVVGVALFVAGGFLNTYSELQRKRFKDDPLNQGKLFTGGLFRLARHINYFGDSVWAAGWAIMTRTIWAASIPILLTAGLVFFFIPSLSAYLKERYGNQYDRWAQRTKAFVPFLY